MTILNGDNWTALYDKGYSFPWLDIKIGNTHADTVNEDEIVTSRSGVGSSLESFYIFRWASTSSLSDVAKEKFNPYFQRIALGDVDADTYKEVFLLRDPGTETGTSLTKRDYSGASTPFDQVIGRNWKAIVAGEVDNDGRAEVVILKDSEIRLYTDPAAGNAYQFWSGSYRTSGRTPMALGDFDGTVTPQPQLGVDPIAFTESLVAGQSVNRTVNVTNVGSTTSFGWTAAVTSGASWLSVTPASGVTPGQLTLTINSTNLAAGGPYAGTVVVTAAGVTGSPKTVTVSLTVQPSVPRLGVSPTTFTEEIQVGNAVDRIVSVTNAGGPPAFAWQATVTQGAGWLSINPATGGTPGSFTLTINAAGLSVGSFVGTVHVEAPNITGSPQDVTVNLKTTAQPFSVAPTAITIIARPGETPPDHLINVLGTGIHWIASVIPAGSRGALEAAAQSGQLERIADGWKLGAEADATFIQDITWVTLTPISGTSPSLLTVKINQGALNPGANWATIVLDGGPSVTPRLLPIDLLVLVAQEQVYVPMATR
jgi:hypothetical protein